MADQANQDTRTCPECGASQMNGTCWEQLGTIIAWEYNDPELLAEHFLTVASYNLQHPAQFTEEALADLRAGVIDRLDNDVPVHLLRQRMSGLYEGKKRVLKPESERQPVLRHWRMTIADVYLPDQPEGAAERVRQWAATIRSEF